MVTIKEGYRLGAGMQRIAFFVHHDGPYHCMRFAGLGECMQFLLTDSEPFFSLEASVQARSDWPRVDQHTTEDPDLARFLPRFPPEYLVIDLRDQPLCTAFSYDGYREPVVQFTRWGHELLWVQRKPRSLRAKILGMFR